MAYVTEVSSAKELTDLEAYREGKIYIQNLSSMVPPLAMDLEPGQKVLDLAAAPGSKTSEIAALLHNTGEIVANDKSHERLYKLRAVLGQQGVTNVTVSQKPGEILWKWHPEYFDSVLVDAPCSMEGRITTEDPDSYKDWSLKKIKVLSQLQKKLLRSAFSSVKVGGCVIYSTCTFSPEENEEVIDWLLTKENGAVEVKKIELPGLEFLPGLTEWRGRQFDTQLAKTGRITPTETMEGFFIAKLRKTNSTVPSLL
jgi:16S rRNA (cytosine1407-C5)-methyltransferase